MLIPSEAACCNEVSKSLEIKNLVLVGFCECLSHQGNFISSQRICALFMKGDTMGEQFAVCDSKSN